MGPNYTPVLFCPSAYFGRNSIQVAPWPTIRCPTSWSAANRLRRRWPLRITDYNFGMVGLSDCRIPAQFGTPSDYGPKARPSFDPQQRFAFHRGAPKLQRAIHTPLSSGFNVGAALVWDLWLLQKHAGA